MSITRCACAVMPIVKKDVLHPAQARRGSSVRTCQWVRRARHRHGRVPIRSQSARDMSEARETSRYTTLRLKGLDRNGSPE
jgi:hypothetical protein